MGLPLDREAVEGSRNVAYKPGDDPRFVPSACACDPTSDYAKLRAWAGYFTRDEEGGPRTRASVVLNQGILDPVPDTVEDPEGAATATTT